MHSPFVQRALQLLLLLWIAEVAEIEDESKACFGIVQVHVIVSEWARQHRGGFGSDRGFSPAVLATSGAEDAIALLSGTGLCSRSGSLGSGAGKGLFQPLLFPVDRLGTLHGNPLIWLRSLEVAK